MNQVEFEKRRVAQCKAVLATSSSRTIKIIELIELLLEFEPSRYIVLPAFFVAALESPMGRLLTSPCVEDKEP